MIEVDKMRKNKARIMWSWRWGPPGSWKIFAACSYWRNLALHDRGKIVQLFLCTRGVGFLLFSEQIWKTQKYNIWFSGDWCYELTPVLSLHPLNKQSSMVTGLVCWRVGKWNSGNSFCVSEGSFPEKQIQPKLLCIGGKTSLIWNEFEGKWSTEKIFWKIAIWCWI